ncbi:hypothetical protein ACFPT7_11100 [Acidicapsa dinghuensis]|uniref:Uncharacterized protein n=1 Tax=Acidicapsa dinghuensis TaxID=2218256 RepID=A0ABW1EHX4_9BACT|nr:hypothetical protein [Acidicapsa dinghuensis]
MGQAVTALGTINWDPTSLAGYVACFFLGMLALSIIVLIWWAPPHKRQIDLTHLLNEVNGQASMSRFQLLLFTFVIAISVFELVMKNGALPDIPEGVLTLLGISATTYAVGKGISYSQPQTLEPDPTPEDVIRAEQAAATAQSHAAAAQQAAAAAGQAATTARVAQATTVGAAVASQVSAAVAKDAAVDANVAKDVSVAAATIADASTNPTGGSNASGE